ncbi:ATP-binding protein [Acutalibacter sp. 1XD8-36]|uniref:ATP-binding protein n=1 Tax=Acutalibacter sp. 1XD8-36 TaxID=2320852 RepID=UPI001411FE86|nr:ATP-binding protein [Acutalibacter sp. 1XD8-36]NBJ89928.1 ATP-binding protein [Acutalibacter sp. 1XD8-36]
MQITRGIQSGAQKVVLYGPEGIGKSTFASKFPEPVFIDTEGSTRHMDVARLPKPSSWTMLLEDARYIRDTPSVCKTLIIDTMDWAEALCTQHVCDTAQKKGVEDFGYGKGYVYVAEEFGKLLNLLDEIIDRGINVLGTAHAKMRKFEQPEETGAYDRWEMKMSKNVAPLVKEWSDALLFANYKILTVRSGEDKKTVKAQGGRRTMYTAHHPCWDAKNRWGLPEEVEFDYSAIAPYIYIGGGAASGTPEPAVPAAPPVEEAAPPAESPKAAPAAAEPVLAPQEQLTINVNPNLPKALTDLMIQNQVEEQEIRLAVSQKGYYPEDTPIENYDPAFISGVLVGAWKKVFTTIMNNRDLPF